MDNQEQLVNDVAEKIKAGQVQPWKAESLLLDEYGMASPEHFRVAALCRRKVIEDLAGHEFRHLELPDKPYLMKWRCPHDDAEWHLSAFDMDTTCAYCGGDLEPLGTDAKRFLPLVNNYIGGREDTLDRSRCLATSTRLSPTCWLTGPDMACWGSVLAASG